MHLYFNFTNIGVHHSIWQHNHSFTTILFPLEYIRTLWQDQEVLHNTELWNFCQNWFYHVSTCSQLYLQAVLCETCIVLACYQCACLASVQCWQSLLCGEANVLFKCGSCCWEWFRGGCDMLKVRGSAMPSLSGLSVLTSPAGWLPERLSVRAVDLSQAHHTMQGRV